MARGTPIIVNRFPAVVEYLGESYPLYFDNIDNVRDILTRDRIEAAFRYLNRPEIKKLISSEKFYEDIVSSSIANKCKLSSV